MEISVAQRQPSLFHTENYYELQQKHSSPFFSTLFVGSFTHCQVAFKLSNKHTLQYIVIKLFFLPTADSWHTLRSIAQYPNTLEQVFDVK